MKKYWHIALMLFCVLMITSCGDDDEALEVDEVWKVQNEEAFQAQMLVPGFEQLSSQSNAGFILYKVLKTGESKEPIYYTSKVECYYKGSFINGEVFDDRSFEAGEPAVMEVYKMTVALPRLYRICIPVINGRFGFPRNLDMEKRDIRILIPGLLL